MGVMTHVHLDPLKHTHIARETTFTPPPPPPLWGASAYMGSFSVK